MNEMYANLLRVVDPPPKTIEAEYHSTLLRFAAWAKVRNMPFARAMVVALKAAMGEPISAGTFATVRDPAKSWKGNPVINTVTGKVHPTIASAAAESGHSFSKFYRMMENASPGDVYRRLTDEELIEFAGRDAGAAAAEGTTHD